MSEPPTPTWNRRRADLPAAGCTVQGPARPDHAVQGLRPAPRHRGLLRPGTDARRQRRHPVDHRPGRAGAVRPEDDEHPRPGAHARQRPHPRGLHQPDADRAALHRPRRCPGRARCSRGTSRAWPTSPPSRTGCRRSQGYRPTWRSDESVEELKLKPGLSAVTTIYTETKAEHVLAVPVQAILPPLEKGGKPRCLRDDPGTARRSATWNWA